MSAIPKRKVEPGEYLQSERSASYKSEYYNGEVFATAGAGRAHRRISINLEKQLDDLLNLQGCELLNSDTRIRCNPHMFTYPDAGIVCGSVQYEDDALDTVLNPIAIIEILSPSTEAYDKGSKFEFYKQIPTFREYILISQDRVKIQQWLRQTDGSWKEKEIDAAGEVLKFESVGVELRLKMLYDRVEFK